MVVTAEVQAESPIRGRWVYLLPAANLDAKCVTPRSGTDPATGRAFPDVAGTATDEKDAVALVDE